MNYLAHSLLAGQSPALVVGGVIGDFIKGPLPGLLPPDLARGVALHRAIDTFAETNPAFCASRSRVSPARRRYAGILVDIFYDHLLARDWGRIHQQPLSDYSASIYSAIASRMHDIATPAHFALQLMAEEDWLSSYAHIDGINDVLSRMSRRARQPNPLAGGEQEFLADSAGFASDFEDWLGDARQFADRWISREIGKG
jgi:acyl carrier protein phosphodiesterase